MARKITRTMTVATYKVFVSEGEEVHAMEVTVPEPKNGNLEKAISHAVGMATNGKAEYLKNIGLLGESEVTVEMGIDEFFDLGLKKNKGN